MELYEEAYGYTHLRLYSHVFMYVLAALHAWRAATLWWKPKAFAIGAFAACIAFVGALNIVNPDAFIAAKNLERYETNGGALDVEYLRELSSDAAYTINRHAQGPYQADLLAIVNNQLGGRDKLPWQSTHFVDLVR
jgi:hypothetical protein